MRLGLFVWNVINLFIMFTVFGVLMKSWDSHISCCYC